jgi:hypothetical protein
MPQQNGTDARQDLAQVRGDVLAKERDAAFRGVG